MRKGNLFQSTLVACAHAAISHKESYLYERYCKISAQRGGETAIAVMSHGMALSISHILLSKKYFRDLRSDYLHAVSIDKIKNETENPLKKQDSLFRLSLS